MDRQTRRKYFERLCELRDDYGRLGAEDNVSVISIEAIIEHAKQQRCDLIVMASHGRRGVAALLLGSETQRVLIHSSLPVLIVK